MLGSGSREMLTFNGIFTLKYKVVILIQNLYDLLSSAENILKNLSTAFCQFNESQWRFKQLWTTLMLTWIYKELFSSLTQGCIQFIKFGKVIQVWNDTREVNNNSFHLW